MSDLADIRNYPIVYLIVSEISESQYPKWQWEEARLAKNRARMRGIIEKMLSEQIKLLSGGEYERVTLELEISKFIRDCLIINLEKGECDVRVIRKAHGRLKQEFKEEFELWEKECE